MSDRIFYRTASITDDIRSRIPNRAEFDRCEDCANKLYNPSIGMSIRWRAKYQLALCDVCVDCRDGHKWQGVPDYSHNKKRGQVVKWLGLVFMNKFWE